MQKFTLVIHGGAGTIEKNDLTPEVEAAYKAGLQQSLNEGYAVLEKGGSAVDAVMAAVVALEDNPLFNAGRGSVFTKKGQHEMDAAIMNGQNLAAGAVAGVRHVRNPIVLAQHVMMHSDHVLLAGEGAQEFAIKQSLRLEPDEYFFSQYRYDQWKEVRDTDGYQLDHTASSSDQKSTANKVGTVGAVACDQYGNIAAATSTGGMTNKQYGRIGDSPLVGAGTYANNKTCAISCTGHGEIFMQAVTAYDISALMDYKGLALEAACREVVMHKLVNMQGEGGVIGVDFSGNAALVFNSSGMYRGIRSSDGSFEIAIHNSSL